MTICERHCDGCQHRDECQMQAAIEYRAEVAAEHRTDPRICAECGCHLDIARRLAELEADVSRFKTVMSDVAAFYERLGAS